MGKEKGLYPQSDKPRLDDISFLEQPPVGEYDDATVDMQR
jgi:hypothetical protein